MRSTLRRRETLEALVGGAYAETDPVKIAESLVDRVASWVPAPTWGVLAADDAGHMSLLGSQGVDEADRAMLHGVAAWVAAERRPFCSSDLSRDGRVESALPASVVGLPLTCRDRVVGALVGFDPKPSARAVRFGAGVLPLLQSMLEVVAVALDHALRLQKAEALSVTDDLTGLYNSRYLRDALHRESKRAVRYGRPLSVLFIDLDGFKSVNDTHGHLCGSRTLVETGAVIRSCSRESDVVARYGGDEFVVVLPDTASEGAVVVARRIRDRIAAHSFLASDGLDVRLTASIGIASLADVSNAPEALLEAADATMYRVKGSGKNNYLLASLT